MARVIFDNSNYGYANEYVLLTESQKIFLDWLIDREYINVPVKILQDEEEIFKKIEKTY